MTLRTITIEIYSNQTSANLAAARMRAPPENMAEVLIKQTSRVLNYENFVSNTEESTIAAVDNSLWLVLGSK